jgi:HAD superfamily hydrolase (TIGR01549 family)
MIKLHHPERFRGLPVAVLLDADNTLYPYDPAHSMAMEAVRLKAERLLRISGERFEKVFGEARNAVKARLGATASSHSRLLYFQALLERLGLGSQVILALDLEQTYWRTFLANAKLFDGVKDFLDDLRMLDIRTAIITDLTAQIQFRKVIYFGLEHCFDYIVTSEEAGFDKPHEAPFRLAMDKMRVAPGPIWMIGDSAKNDICGASRTIGAVTLQKLHAGIIHGEGERMADAIFSEFTALRTLLADLTGKREPATA